MTSAIDLSHIPWVPDDIALALQGRVIDFPIPPRMRARFDKPPRMPMVKWAQQYRNLGKDKGLWSRRKTPHAVGIMSALDHPMVEMVVVCKGPQTGGTETILNFIGSAIQQAPADMMCIMPDDENARMLCNDRIQPMINASSALSQHMTGSDSDVSGKRLSLDNMTIYLASANSASQLSSRACRYVLFDEVDKYPPTANKAEADPISLGIARTTTFETTGRKMLMVSTPTTESGNIWKQLCACQYVFHYWVQCPHCRRFQPMIFKNIRWDGGSKASANHIEAHKLARYMCGHCGVLWDDSERDDAVLRGQWRADSGGQERFADLDARAGDMRGKHLAKVLRETKVKSVGFHVPAWVSPFSSMSASAGAFLRAPHKEAGWKDFANRFEGLPWVNVLSTREESQILALRTELADGIVPDWADVLLLGADTQDNGLWYEVRAFKFGALLRSHSVRRGFVDSFAALSDVLRSVYESESGRKMQVQRGFIDAMGHRTAEVYDWCRVATQVWPIKGAQKLNIPLPDPTKLDRMPNGRAIPGGILLQHVDVNYFKDIVAGKLQVNADDPGAFTWGAGLTPKHARHYIAEELDPKTNFWTCAQGKDNHLWDCSVYAMACAYKWGVQFEQVVPQQQTPRPARNKPQRMDRGW